ncbi:MAG: hypothetical protein E7496_10665 [Ruminococcus sp.]|nr:hypothetical protein [Ruminococcus sp.]
MDKRDRRHAIVEIECMLEDDYKLKKTMNSHIINAFGNNIIINNAAKYILGNMILCEFIVVFLFAFSCYACIFDFFKISLSELTSQFFNPDSVVTEVSDAVFFWIGAFCMFVILYSNQSGKATQTIFSIVLLIIVLIARALTNSLTIDKMDISIIPMGITVIPILLLILFSKIDTKGK